MAASDAFTAKTIRRADDLLSTAIGDNMLMMSIAAGKYFNLNLGGARIWEALATPITFEALIADLVATFDVSEETAREDTARFLDALLERRLIVVEETTA